jgi:hypothetical protein
VVDVCEWHVLRQVPNELTTKVAGADPLHASDPFYSDEFDDDANRVNKLFENPPELGAPLFCASSSRSSPLTSLFVLTASR